MRDWSLYQDTEYHHWIINQDYMTNGLTIVNSRSDATPKLPAILPGSIPKTVHFSLFEESNNFKFIQTLQNKSNTDIYSTDKY